MPPHDLNSKCRILVSRLTSPCLYFIQVSSFTSNPAEINEHFKREYRNDPSVSVKNLPKTLLHGSKFTFFVRVENFLGARSAVAEKTVTVSSDRATVWLNAPQTAYAHRTLTLMSLISTESALCGRDSPDLDWSWDVQLTADDGSILEAPAVDLHRRDVQFELHTIPPEATILATFAVWRKAHRALHSRRPLSRRKIFTPSARCCRRDRTRPEATHQRRPVCFQVP